MKQPQKLKEKKLFRSSKEEKEKFVEKNLSDIGISDIDKFKKDLKKMNPEKMKEELQKLI